MKTRDMILIGTFAALTAIGAFVRIETPFLPFTLQFLFCAYSGVLLGARKGFMSQVIYVGIGLAGIPIFTKGGGITYIFQPTFGYLLGFILCATVIGFLTQQQKKVTFFGIFLPVIAGLTMVYMAGVPYLYAIVNFYFHKTMPFSAAIAAGFTPFIVPDLILSIVVALTALKVVPILRRSGLIEVPVTEGQ